MGKRSNASLKVIFLMFGSNNETNYFFSTNNVTHEALFYSENTINQAFTLLKNMLLRIETEQIYKFGEFAELLCEQYGARILKF